MEISENAKIVLEKRYLTKDEKGQLIETAEGMLKRVARAIASADSLYDSEADLQKTEEEFYKIMDNLYFLPNSPTLMNAGKDLGQLAACFVLPVGDSMEEIFDAIKDAALIHKSGGGTGFSFSRIRAKGSAVQSTGGVASGPVSFMKVFNASTEAVKQGGTRRGANMGVLRIDHPDILEFISAKENIDVLTNFNISVALTDKFMEALKKGKDYELIDPVTGKATGTLSAKEVFNEIVYQAWKTGEPGIVFIDRINKFNTVPGLGSMESTNPCGEQPLLPYESCNLGSLNLLKMVKKADNGYNVDYDKLESTIKTAVHFLDNVIDCNKYPLEKIEKISKATRKIGLGVMGFADLLVLLGLPYNSEEAVEFASDLMKFIDDKAKEASCVLAEKRGVFPAYEKSIYAEQGLKIRNATRTTIAPTGTISLIAGASSGIEPIFSLVYERTVMDGTVMTEINPVFAQILEEYDLKPEEVSKELLEKGKMELLNNIPGQIKDLFVTAHEVEPSYHIKMQAAFQEHVDNAVSKTVNFPALATIEEVKETYLLAEELGLKGITIYRDTSREGQVLSVKKPKAEEKVLKGLEAESGLEPRVRPDITQGLTEKVKIGCGNLYITVNYDKDGICEVFTNLGRGGGCPSQSEATSRLISIALRSGVKPEEIIEQLKGIRCQSTLRRKVTDKNIKVLSCPDAIGRALEKTLNTFVPVESNTFDIIQKIEEEETVSIEKAYCPECGSIVEHEGGCLICRACGFSKCG